MEEDLETVERETRTEELKMSDGTVFVVKTLFGNDGTAKPDTPGIPWRFPSSVTVITAITGQYSGTIGVGENTSLALVDYYRKTTRWPVKL